MPYLVAVVADRMVAEQASINLEQAGLDQVSLLGRGYLSADEFGLVDPTQPAQRQMTLMSFWLVPFGFVGGYGFSVLSGLQTFAWAGSLGNHLIGGILGAMGGAMGSFFVGGGVGLAVGGGDALTYRNRLAQGRYLVIVQGSAQAIKTATPILRNVDPESLQGYEDPVEMV